VIYKGLRRFFVEEIQADNGSCSITGSEARHITKVLRMGRGNRFILMDGKGSRFVALIKSASAREVHLSLEEPLPNPPPSPVEIILCQSLIKSRAMDYLVQKTSELGANCIIPYSSKRTVVRLDKNRVSNRVRHWREIANNAAKQSDGSSPAEIPSCLPFQELLSKWSGGEVLKTILWEEEGSNDLKHVLRSSPPMRTFIGIVGPEGGFAHEEIEAARNAGFLPISLGRRVLRSETAAVTIVAIVQYEWGDLGLGI
jgi:16S rRNA (uracil1498-N3)-methyltransferase